MTATFKLTRVVKAKRRRTELVQSEVRAGLEELAQVVQRKFESTVADWDAKPKFETVVSVTRKKWVIYTKVAKNTKAGKIFGWVDVGTGARGGGQSYEIRPKKAAYLQFKVPHSPISMPNPSVQGFPPGGDAKTIRAEVINHPGIYPRNFTKTIVDWLKSKQPGAFRSVVEARVKRALRKMRS
jgi:hypothetical protein